MAHMIVAGNWKMNASKSAVTKLLSGLKQGVATVTGAQLLVFPPFPYLAQVQAELSATNIHIGVQNICAADKGAYTGEVSLAMAKEFGASYVLVGHSERRALYAENDTQVAAKYVATQAAQLTPILCVGETLEERQQGLTLSVVSRQIEAVIAAAGGASFANAVIAYEPVWAIGTGMIPKSKDLFKIIKFIKSKFKDKQPKVLYGGSVSSQNINNLKEINNIDGFLIGGASQNANKFIDIVKKTYS